MRPFTIREEDGTAIAALCHMCGGEIYEEETCYRVNGETICRGCLAVYAARELAAFAVRGGEVEW